MTWGYCVQCGEYAYGRYRWMIEDRAEAIEGHRGYPFSPKTDTPPVGGEQEVSRFDRTAGDVIPGALDEPRRGAGDEPKVRGLLGRELVELGDGRARRPGIGTVADPPARDEVAGAGVRVEALNPLPAQAPTSLHTEPLGEIGTRGA